MCPPRFNSVGKGQQSSTAQTLRVRKQQQQALKSQKKKKTEKEHKTAIKGRKKRKKRAIHVQPHSHSIEKRFHSMAILLLQQLAKEHSLSEAFSPLLCSHEW